jgi:hypothetical protein
LQKISGFCEESGRPEQYSDPAESDTTRAYNNRLQINVYLRLPMHGEKGKKPGTVSVADAAQSIPGRPQKLRTGS